MTRKHLYEPCLNRIDDDWESRWNAILAIVNAWYGCELDLLQASSSVAGDSVARTYPHSVRQWIKFCNEVRDKVSASVLRETFVVENINSPPALSLQELSEGNVCWAVLNEHLKLDDPPVCRLTGDCHGDYDENLAFADRWEYEWQSDESVSEFAFSQVEFMLRGESGGCSVEVHEDSEKFIEEMKEFFQRATWFAGTCVFESPDIFATVRNRRLNIEVRGRIGLSELPDCVVRNINHGGAFRGILIPQRSKNNIQNS